MYYEVHITFKSATWGIPMFIEDCERAGVKPIIIETQNGENELDRQVMTSSKHNDMDHMLIAHRIRTYFVAIRGYEVIRQKVEIQPGPFKHPGHCYFESHFRLKLQKSDWDKALIGRLARLHGFHMSKNLFKTDAVYDYQMLTYRSTTDYNTFTQHLDEMRHSLEQFGIEYDKVEIEECIFDSNATVDDNWLNGS